MKLNKKIKQYRKEIRQLMKDYDAYERGGTGRGLIDEELIRILATHFYGHYKTKERECLK